MMSFCCRRGACRQAAGRPLLRSFTLIELVMVIAIVTVLASMAIPRFAGSITRHHVEMASSRIVRDLELARRTACAASAPRAAKFDVATHSYTLEGLANLDHAGAVYQVHLDREPYGVELIQADLGGDASIVFDGYGQPDSGGTVVVRAGRYQDTVSIDAADGTIDRESEVVLPQAIPQST